MNTNSGNQQGTSPDKPRKGGKAQMNGKTRAHAEWKSKSSLEKVKTYLENSGYVLEFETANIFSIVGFERVWQNEYLPPTQDEKRPEIDVIARTAVIGNDEITGELRYDIACKWSKENPWIILANSSEKIYGGGWKAAIAGTELAKASLWHREYIQSAPGGLLDFSGQHGRSVVTAVPRRDDHNLNKVGDDSFFYKTVKDCVQNAKAGISRIEDCQKDELEHKFPTKIRIIIPTIVLDGELFVAKSCKPGKLQLEQVDYARIYWRGSKDFSSILVEVITKSYVPTFAATRQKEAKDILESLIESAASLKKSFDACSYVKPFGSPGGSGHFEPPFLINLIEKRAAQKTQ